MTLEVTTDLRNRPDMEPINARIDDLVHIAKEVALPRVDSPAARDRVETALEGPFRQYTLEAEVIASDLTSPEYEAFVERTTTYLRHTRIGWIACPDGRIIGLAMGPARVSSGYRKLRGLPRTRLSSKTNEPLPINPVLNASINAAFQQREREHLPKLLIEFIGPHIYSPHPDHGCGATASKLSGFGSGLPVTAQTMWDGGLGEYFQEAEETGVFQAFNNVARRAGGDGVTFDLTHDIETQGLIWGLRHAHRDFDPSVTLRKNLLELADQHAIVMTELLAERWRPHIVGMIQKLDTTFSPSHPKNMRDFAEFGNLSMLIGTVTLELTEQLEKEGFSFLPAKLQSETSPDAIRVLAYHLVWNTVYQIVGGIKHGHHELVHHPERVLRAGPIGADFNVATIPFILGTAEKMGNADVADAFALYGLMGRFLPEQGVDLEKEARVVMTTAAFNPDIYKNENAAESDRQLALTYALENASMMRNALKGAEQAGYTVILPVWHHTVRRSLSIIEE